MALISFAHRLIFIKTVKTAGTSIEVDLSQRLEDAAIVTPVNPPIQGHHPRNCAVADDPQGYFAHMSAKQIRTLLGAQTFTAFTKICVERAPLAKCISHFHMWHNSDQHNAAFADSWEDYCAVGRFPVNVDMYSEIRAGVRHSLVDHVLRYDQLETALPAVLARCGIKDFKLTSRAKSEYSRNTVITPDQVTAPQRAKINAAFAETLALTGITWDD